MKTRTVKMHYCEYCKKRGQRRDIIAKHEAHCTGNPERKCGMCDWLGGVPMRPADAAKLIDVIEADDNIGTYKKADLTRLRAAVNNCPACILAAVRVFNATHNGDDDWWVVVDFSWKKESAEFWKEVNDE